MTFDHKMLRDLKPGWDSYSAKPIDPRCIEKAFQLWREIPGPWIVVPCADGGVQIEQHRDGLDIEITISPAGSTQETRARPEHTAAHDCACEECMAAETRGDALPIPDFLRNQENLRAEQAVPKSDSVAICCDCPPLDYPTDKTRCAECPRLNRGESL